MGLLDKLIKKDSTPSIDFSKLEYFNEFLIVGEQYKSKMNPKTNRLDLMKKTKVGDIVKLVEFKYKGESAYMVVSERLKCDLGVLSAGAASWVKSKNCRMVGYISEPYKNSYQIKLHKEE